MRRKFGFISIALSAVILAQCSGSSTTPPAHTPGSTEPPPVAGSPIKHVIVIIQENRTLDNMFNQYPGANTVTSGLDHNGNTVQLQPVGLAAPIDPDHAHPSLVTEYDNGKMDGFDLDTCDLNALDPFSACTPPPDYTYAYVPGLAQTSISDTTLYWLLAQFYSLSDEMFATRQVPSFPGHQYLIAGQGPADDPICQTGATNCKQSTGLTNGIWGCDAPAGTIAGQFGATYSAPEIFTNPPCYDYQAMADLLNAKGVSWKYYTGAVGTLDGLISGYDAIKHIRYSKYWNTNISTPMTNILNDIQNNSLPSVSFVTPPGPASDHAGFLQSGGPGWVGEIYLFLTQNPSLYNDTAVFVTWDDSGGWYDHVSPPCYDNRVLPATTCDQNGPLGFRVPLLAISPYTIVGVNHDVHDYGSILHYIEKNWGLGNLGTDDVLADDLSDLFNYSQTPIQPVLSKDRRFEQLMSRYSKSYFEHLHGDHPVDSE